MTANDCKSNIDTLKLIHQGTSQDQRVSAQLKPDYVKVDERKIENDVVFAKAYANYLKFYGRNNTATGDWAIFFNRDVSVQLAMAAIQDIEYYKINVKASFDFLNNRDHKDKISELKIHLGYLFSTIATLASQFERLKESLPDEITLKATLRNLIQSQLAPALAKLIRYHKAFPDTDTTFAKAHPDLTLFEANTLVFADIYTSHFSKDWITDGTDNWQTYVNTTLTANNSVYGSGVDVFERLNHIATHNQFTAIFDQFLKVFARVVIDAKAELEKTFSNWDNHEPHYALFLAFLKLFDYARAETNTLTQKHLDFYYRDILKLKEKPAEPSHAHLLIELAKHVDAHKIKKGELFKAGKDDLGIDVFFANKQDFVANQAKVTELKTLYRHKNTVQENLAFQNNRLFASPVANSADGLGAKLTTVDQSWHPLANKIYESGTLKQIAMPQAEVGFALASHYLWLAEGDRTVTVDFKIANATVDDDYKNEIVCLVSTEKGWFSAQTTHFNMLSNDNLQLVIKLDGAAPAITPYLAKIHGYTFATDLPVLLVKLVHNDKTDFIYAALEAITVQEIAITADVIGLKTLAVSNDFGSVDTSKPFQPFGALPVANSALIIGSKEVFQKALASVTINVKWQNPPKSYDDKKTVNLGIDYLKAGKWQSSGLASLAINQNAFLLDKGLDAPVVDEPDFSSSELYNSTTKHGFVRLATNSDFGQTDYEQALIEYIKSVTDTNKEKENDKPKPSPLVSPVITELNLDYTTAPQTIQLLGDKSNSKSKPATFFHLTSFGQCGQQSATQVFLLPQFDNAEFYIGITALNPAQNLTLLFQVADGSADPLVEKPKPHSQHIQWRYLGNNEWLEFGQYDVQDNTDGLINSGIITFAMPNTATATNTLLPAGQHWLKAAVTEKSEAVCKLLAVSAQSLKVIFDNQNNDPAFLANTLAAETINKLKQPDAAVKKVSQPFASFGGRAAEQPLDFYTRVSERLRHKDRAITLWDYEHLILEAFPQIYRVKCLNHTAYEADTYNELAAGHVTIVTIPNQQFHNLHNPLKPYTSLGLLADIESFLQKKLSCFVKLHVKNPQFEEVRIGFKVKFYEGFDKSFYKKTLDTAITHFLSPWAFSDGGNPTFGGKVYLSTLLNFVEERDYVDYVTDFSFIKSEADGSGVLAISEIEGSKAISILVSANHHKIEDVPNSNQTIGSGETCGCAS
jgi:hypothetical protein